MCTILCTHAQRFLPHKQMRLCDGHRKIEWVVILAHLVSSIEASSSDSVSDSTIGILVAALRGCLPAGARPVATLLLLVVPCDVLGPASEAVPKDLLRLVEAFVESAGCWTERPFILPANYQQDLDPVADWLHILKPQRQIQEAQPNRTAN